MNKSQQQDLMRLFQLHEKLDQLEGKLMTTLPIKFGQSYPVETQIMLAHICHRAQCIATIATGLKNL